MYLFRLAIVATMCTSCLLQADERLSNLKFEGGLVIAWQPISKDARANQIEISDEHGHLVAAVNVLAPVRDARRVSIYDVSARGNLIAVAAVYENEEGSRRVRPAAALLTFDATGQLLSVFALAASHAIGRLAVDDKLNIWTLTDGAGKGIDPSTVPMVVEYTAGGKIERQLLTRNQFGMHALETQENVEMGAPAMGYDEGFVWFWLPGSTDFVTISTSDAKVAMTKTQLPPNKAGRYAVPLSMRREASGSLVAQVGEDDEQGNRVIAHYVWSPTKAWVAFKPGKCEGRLIGVGDKGQIYHPYQGDSAGICAFRSTQ